MKTCTILGTEIAVTTMEETVRYIEEHMEELRGKYICVSNVHTTVTAYEDESYRKVQNGAGGGACDRTGSDGRTVRERQWADSLFLRGE